VPYGSATAGVDFERVSALLTRDASRLARYYDAVLLIARPDTLVAGLAASLPSPEYLYCVQPGITELQRLRSQLDAARAAGAVVRGIVERPVLEAVASVRKRATVSAETPQPQPQPTAV
jgi:hypothetical protein